MKKVLVALLVALISISTIFAGGSKESTVENTLGTVTPGKLTVATSPDFAPYEFYSLASDGTPTLAGFDVSLAGYIADELGLELVIVPMEFEGVLAELTTKSVDLGMAGLSPDPARMDAMDFSDIYYYGGQSLMTVKSKLDKYPDIASTNMPGVSVGAQIGSIQADLANENSPNADIILLQKVTDIFAELLSGKMEAAYIETDVGKSYQKNYPDLAFISDVPYDAAGSAIGVQKGNAALLEAVNAAIKKCIESGQMGEFIAEASALAEGEKYEGLLENK